MTRAAIFDAISRERARQDAKHGTALAVERIPVVLGEEFGEVCKALNDREPPHRVVEELIHVAAVCVKAIEGMEDEWRGKMAAAGGVTLNGEVVK